MSPTPIIDMFSGTGELARAVADGLNEFTRFQSFSDNYGPASSRSFVRSHPSISFRHPPSSIGPGASPPGSGTTSSAATARSTTTETGTARPSPRSWHAILRTRRSASFRPGRT